MEQFPVHFHINVVALLVAAFARMVVGALWYSPAMFAKPWMKLVNCDPGGSKSGLPKILLADFVASFIMAFVLVHAVHYAGARTATQGAMVGFLNWLGFVATVTFAMGLYEKRPLKLFAINNGFQAISIVIMGAILAVWV